MLTLQEILNRLNHIIDTWHDTREQSPLRRLYELTVDIERTIALCEKRLAHATPISSERKP